MMETIRIRRAGYPIRHTFADFVDRYRILVSGVGPAHSEDCRAASTKICKAVLGGADFQLGKTKVFLKDAQDAFLEQERDRMLTRKILTIQKAIRGWHYRQKFRMMKQCCVTIQAYWRAYSQKQRYLQVSKQSSVDFNPPPKQQIQFPLPLEVCLRVCDKSGWSAVKLSSVVLFHVFCFPDEARLHEAASLVPFEVSHPQVLHPPYPHGVLPGGMNLSSPENQSH